MAQATANAPTREVLIDRARELVPVLKDRAETADNLRRLPDETHRDLADSELYHIYLPARFGGFELDYMLQVDIAAELGRGCGSAAWVHAVVASHSWMHGMFTPEAQDEVWGSDTGALIAGSTPTADAHVEPVDDGFVLNGKWSFASGVDFCSWNHFNMMTPKLDGE